MRKASGRGKERKSDRDIPHWEITSACKQREFDYRWCALQKEFYAVQVPCIRWWACILCLSGLSFGDGNFSLHQQSLCSLPFTNKNKKSSHIHIHSIYKHIISQEKKKTELKKKGRKVGKERARETGLFQFIPSLQGAKRPNQFTVINFPTMWKKKCCFGTRLILDGFQTDSQYKPTVCTHNQFTTWFDMRNPQSKTTTLGTSQLQ